VKGGGHGNYRTIVLAPHSVQEMADLTALAFELADRYRNPVCCWQMGFIGQMMRAGRVSADGRRAAQCRVGLWRETKETRGNFLTSLVLDNDGLEKHQLDLEAKYRRVEECEVRAEEWQTEDAEIVLVG